MEQEKSHAAIITFIATILVIVIGVAMVFSTKYYTIDDLSKEIFTSIGITLIAAGTVGVITEIFLMWAITKKMLHLESKFLESAIPQIIKTVNDWVEQEGKNIPIDKNSLYNLIRIGYSQWFMQEDFEKISIPPSKVAQLYQDVQLGEFKDPVILDFSCIVEHKGKSDSLLTGRDNLIDISMSTKFVAANTANKDSNEIRYVNKNGVINIFAFDIFGKLPIDDVEKKEYVKKIDHTLRIQNGESSDDFSITLIEMDARVLSRIIEKDVIEITKIIEDKINDKINSKHAFILYQFLGYESNESKKLLFAVFCPYPLKPQERITVSHTRTLPFAENDFLNTSMKSLTRGLTFELKGFDGFDTSISKNLLNDEKDTVIHTATMLSTSSLMLPRSLVLMSWQKKI